MSRRGAGSRQLAGVRPNSRHRNRRVERGADQDQRRGREIGGGDSVCEVDEAGKPARLARAADIGQQHRRRGGIEPGLDQAVGDRPGVTRPHVEGEGGVEPCQRPPVLRQLGLSE